MKKEILKGEMMNDEQLDAVVGGNRGELSCDTKFLHAIGLMDHYYEPSYCGSHFLEVADEVNSALKKTGRYGVGITYNPNANNKYLLVELGTGVGWYTKRAELYQVICNAIGRPDFDYRQFL